MRISKGDLIGLPAYTLSENFLGKVSDFDLDPVSHFITHYHIKSGDLIKGLLNQELLVAKDQVLSISKEKMVVEDSIIESQEAKKQVLEKPLAAN
ncbi:MAG: hypothetical protein WCV50_06500 [Patescibacteria group bacterium]|jgi:hypothetical protein